jgi:hypothetical protein
MMRSILFLTAVLFLQFQSIAKISEKKPQVIVMTDGEVDDQSSMIRFLLYTCDMDVRAIIETNSKWQREGHSKEDWLEKLLAAYEKVHPNLLVHNKNYPSADYLRSISFVGDEDPAHLDTPRSNYYPGKKEYRDPSDWADTPGSDKIVDLLLENSKEPIYVQIWGGGNTLSRALYKLKEEYPEKYEHGAKRVSAHFISYQDGAGTYLEQKHPMVTKVADSGFDGTWNYNSQTDTYDLIASEVITGHGPLGALYPQSYVSEGDSPSFFYCLPNGLRNYEHPTFGGWGGRYEPMKSDSSVFVDAYESGSMRQSQARWIRDVNADFMARMDWCVASEFKQANHAPVLKVNTPVNLTVKSGEAFQLSVEGTKDPDGDLIDFYWWIYQEAGSHKDNFPVQYQEGHTFKATAPKVVKTETIHIIVEASDFPSKGPGLKIYQRFVIEVQP